MPGLLETAASLAVAGAMMGSMLAGLAGATRVTASAAAVTADLFVRRQLEHLIDRAALSAGAGPGRPSPASASGGERVIFHADTSGDGVVDGASSETITVDLTRQGRRVRVRHRLGQQSMTILDLQDADARLDLLDVFGSESAPGTGTLVVLEIAPAGAPARTLHFAVPATLGRRPTR